MTTIQAVDPSATNNTMSLTGAEAIVEILEQANVGPMFGMGGFQLLPFYEAVRVKGLTHFLINDERCGVFASDAYARVAGKPGVCDATLGPGATNLVTGLVESLNAGIPQVVFVGNTHRDHSWKNMTQESRQIDILRPAVKEVIRIERSSRVPELVRRAFAVATSGRPGPVVVDVPEDIAHDVYDYPVDDFWIDPVTTASPAYRSHPAAEDVAKAAQAIAKAKRPLLLVGGGIHNAGAYKELLNLAEAQAIPVAHTLSGKGAIACTHELSAGLFGRYSRIANDLIDTADCLIVVGCKLGEIATKRFALFNKNVPLIHLDVLPEEIGRTTPADVALIGDAKCGLGDLSTALCDESGKAIRDRASYVQEIPARMTKWREGAKDKLTDTSSPIGMGRMLTELNKAMPAESVLIADGGFAAHWGGLLYDTKRAGRRFVADRGFASIGYGLPGAMGVQLAVPEQPVVAITGDGGFNMVIGELETALRAKTPFTLMIVNNAASGYIKSLQHAMYGNYQSSDLVEMNYANIAESFGCHGVRVEDPEELGPAIRVANAERSKPSVVDVVVTRDPAKMLPGVDSRTLKIKKGDRPV
ncbi:thiamine pyrophosphate-binding protein [Hoeflea prorocentri]|uniref:Thiamine pyrophosphate-binding protein n=1 Tax=Hoeflea prorocentri TaxID=1922333 RepID=A0A9X3ZG34_9HYPH|nr:thiamine pyrophosphate-binding protein [Hoeflea prorocentri]MCY6379395.1 thiamine pyrophosphate-binding protein [Hoeflea prorocentri]MDA5397196.1 thiamine pyrophosphate-binding protein [Hoeflea prorocentri]